MTGPESTFPSREAVAWWNGSTQNPIFAHRGCMKQTYGFKRVGGTIEIRNFDRCVGCGGSLFAEPAR